jgi:site-specific recombinase XerD
VKDELKIQIRANSSSVQNIQTESSYRTLSSLAQIQTDATREFLPDFVQFSRTLSSLARTLSGVQILAQWLVSFELSINSLLPPTVGNSWPGEIPMPQAHFLHS